MSGETIEEARARYSRAAHRVQSAIAFTPRNPDPDAEFKHTRVGIDMSKADQGGLARLLIAKGVFTELEYIQAMADGAEREADMQERLLSEALGRNVKTV